MRYSFVFKLKCIKSYRQGVWPETPAQNKMDAPR